MEFAPAAPLASFFLFLLFLLSRAAVDERRPPTVTEGGRRDGAAVELLAGVRARPVAEHAAVE